MVLFSRIISAGSFVWFVHIADRTRSAVPYEPQIQISLKLLTCQPKCCRNLILDVDDVDRNECFRQACCELLPASYIMTNCTIIEKTDALVAIRLTASVSVDKNCTKRARTKEESQLYLSSPRYCNNYFFHLRTHLTPLLPKM